MRVLLDTHALYWFIEGDVKLSNTAAAVIGEPTNTILFSPASYWEMAIKISLGKWQLNQPYADFIDIALVNYRFEILEEGCTLAKPYNTRPDPGEAFPSATGPIVGPRISSALHHCGVVQRANPRLS